VRSGDAARRLLRVRSEFLLKVKLTLLSNREYLLPVSSQKIKYRTALYRCVRHRKHCGISENKRGPGV